MILRWAELVALFIGIPLVLAFLLPPDKMWTVLLLSGAAGLVLLHFTHGFEWRSLLQGKVNWHEFFLLGAATLLVSSLLCYWLLPDRMFRILLEMPLFIPILSIAYPIILVLPQELLFRPLFFKRYGHLFASERLRIWVNAGLFSFAHLMYWHWVVFLLTFLGSFIFARSYLRGSFPEAVAHHSIAGLMVFLSGLGWLFYSGGNVAQ